LFIVDVIVGAYESDMAFVFRTRPIILPEITMAMSPSPIPLNGSAIPCSIDGIQLCFETQVVIHIIDRRAVVGKNLNEEVLSN